VQGKLRNEYLKVQIETKCAHCSCSMQIEIDSNLRFKTNDDRCEPVVFVPDVDLLNLKDDSIIDSF
jgi:hypothetical protein